MYQCQSCEKTFSRKNNMKRHQIQTCKRQEQNRPTTSIIRPTKENILGDILNKVVQRAEMDVKPMTKTISPQKPLEENIPMEVVNNFKPKPLTEILEEQSDLEAEGTDSDESEGSDSDEIDAESVEFMPDNPEDLKKCFRELFYKLHGNIGIYNKLVYILDELKRMSCLTKEECDFMNKHLQEKMNI